MWAQTSICSYWIYLICNNGCVALSQGYPAIVALLEFQMFLAPRVLKSLAMASDFVFPTRSLVAGSSKGVSLAKLFLGPILEAAHTKIGLWTISKYMLDSAHWQRFCSASTEGHFILEQGLTSKKFKKFTSFRFWLHCFSVSSCSAIKISLTQRRPRFCTTCKGYPG